MKTYTKRTDEPLLVIEHDEDAPSPRENDNIGLFFTKESRYKSPDGNMRPLYQIMIDTENEAQNTEHHIKLIKEQAHNAFKESEPTDGNSHDEDLHIIEIHPVYRYEHGNVIYKRGTAGGFDYSNCGFYIVTAKSLDGRNETAESIARAIDAELEEYTQWANGEVYCFTLHDIDGEQIDACGGYYSLEAIRENLPDEWKKEDLNQYIK